MKLRVETTRGHVSLETCKTRGPSCILPLFFFAASRANYQGARLPDGRFFADFQLCARHWAPGCYLYGYVAHTVLRKLFNISLS
jgi:hypothetical protein